MLSIACRAGGLGTPPGTRAQLSGSENAAFPHDDDLVVGFESRMEAERFRSEFRERLAKFGLELHPEKTRLIEFGRFAAQNRKQCGEGKPETFTFLGFTHYCGKLRKNGAFTVWRVTAKKRMVAKPTIWNSPSPKFIMGGSDEEKFDHPTQKPVELMRRPILNHTKVDRKSTRLNS